MYHLEGTDIVINGWEQGISDNPFKGINDMRGVNIISTPGEASVSFAPVLNSFSPLSLSITSANSSTNIITATITSGVLDVNNKGYQAITFSGAGLPGGIVAGTVYWIIYISATTFKLSIDPFANTVLTITGTGTGTGTSIDMGEITYFDIRNVTASGGSPYALDKNGRAWIIQQAIPQNGYKWTYLGNTTLTLASGNGLVFYMGYLFIFRGFAIDYYNIVSNVWVYGWNPNTGGTTSSNIFADVSQNFIHAALYGQDNIVYFLDGKYVGSFLQKSSSVAFNPSDTTTFTWNKIALPLPSYEVGLSIEELGVSLLIGGSYNYIYPWDRTSTNFRYPIKISDNGIVNMLTVNTNTYIFAGKRGRIYVTNGNQANLYAKVPDQISGDVDPILNWKGVAYNKNQIYFGIYSQNNDTSYNPNYSGLWAIDITNNSLRVVNLQSNPTAYVTALAAPPSFLLGFGLEVAWHNFTDNKIGIDSTTSAPYTQYTSYIETDIIPVGQYLTKKTFENIEFKLAKPLVSGEGIKISYRLNRTGAYTLVKEFLATSTYLPISDYATVNFDQAQWVQFKIEMKSVASNPSYVRFYELRIR